MILLYYSVIHLSLDTVFKFGLSLQLGFVLLSLEEIRNNFISDEHKVCFIIHLNWKLYENDYKL